MEATSSWPCHGMDAFQATSTTVAAPEDSSHAEASTRSGESGSSGDAVEDSATEAVDGSQLSDVDVGRTQGRTSTTLYCRVRPGMKPGDVLQGAFHDRPLSLTVPIGAKPGDTIAFQVELTPGEQVQAEDEQFAAAMRDVSEMDQMDAMYWPTSSVQKEPVETSRSSVG